MHCLVFTNLEAIARSLQEAVMPGETRTSSKNLAEGGQEHRISLVFQRPGSEAELIFEVVVEERSGFFFFLVVEIKMHTALDLGQPGGMSEVRKNIMAGMNMVVPICRNLEHWVNRHSRQPANAVEA